MAMSAEWKAQRAADRKREKELSKLIPIASRVKVTGDDFVSVELGNGVKLHGKVKAFNVTIEQLGYRPVRITSNMLNEASGKFCIDINTPSYCDPGSESYHSM